MSHRVGHGDGCQGLPQRCGFLSVAGQQLEFAAIEGGEPTLLLLHEGLGCIAMWKDFPLTLAARTGCAVWAYSRSGYGASSPIDLPRPVDFHTREALDVLPGVLDAVGAQDYVLVGHSDGASIALIHAGLVADPRVSGVVALAPHVLAEQKCLATIREARQAFETTELRARLARYHGDNVDCAFRGWNDAWLDPDFRDWSIEPALAGIRVPVLAIRGGDDPYNTGVHLERITACVPGRVTAVELSGCGHAPHIDARDAVIARIQAFTTALPSRWAIPQR